MLDAYVPMTSLLVIFVLGLCGYVCFLVGYRRALADFPVDDVEQDEVAQLSLRQTSTQERLTALEEQAYTEGYDRSPGSYFERLTALEDWKASLGKLGNTSLPEFDDLVERVDELERVNTKQVFDERVERSVPFGQWALKVSERSKVNQGNIEDILSPRLELLVERVEELERQT